MTRRLLIVPAAGAGSRLGSSRPKPLVAVQGRPMLDHVIDIYAAYVEHVVVVANPAAAGEIDAWRRGRETISIVLQPSPTGMLDAILLAAGVVEQRRPGAIWISWADQVGVRPATVRRLAELTAATPPPPLVLPTAMTRDPYTHFARDAGGRIVRLLQRREGDLMPAEGESDMGVFALGATTFIEDLCEYAADMARGEGTGERNFLPFVPWLAARKPVITFPCADAMEAVGINTPEELRLMEAWLATQ